MSDRKKMSVDEMSLLIRAIHREWIQKPSCIMIVSDSLFFNKIHIFYCNDGDVWPTIDDIKYECRRPTSLFFKRKEKKQFDDAIKLYNEMRAGQLPNSLEEIICKH